MSQIIKENSRPSSLPRYELVEDANELDHAFFRLRESLFQLVEQWRQAGSRIVFREKGQLAPGRSYFFLKPFNETGWLFERSESGWMVTQAEKIVEKSLFLRRSGIWDRVELFSSRAHPEIFRVSSEKLGLDTVNFGIYQERLLAQLGLAPQSSARRESW